MQWSSQYRFKLIVSLLFLGYACNGILKPVDNFDDLKKGYRFKHGMVMYEYIDRSGGLDSVRKTIDSFTIVDTLIEYKKYIIADSFMYFPLAMPRKDLKGIDFPTGPKKYAVYGVADFSGEIIIYPSFKYWQPIVNGFYSFSRDKRNINEICSWGLLHVNGVVVTDVKYDLFFYDSASHKIICQNEHGAAAQYDSIPAVFNLK